MERQDEQVKGELEGAAVCRGLRAEHRGCRSAGLGCALQGRELAGGEDAITGILFLF